MKKIFVLLFVIVLVFGVDSSFAYDDEILFQNIPWGSSQTEVQDTEKVLYKDGKFILEYFYYGFDDRDCFDDDGKTVTRKLLYFDYLLFSDLDQRVNIAGYDARVHFVFSAVCEPGSEIDFDNIDFATLNSLQKQLIEVYFSMNPPNKKEAQEDLANKLTAIYGKSEKNETGYGLLWKGNNNTEIELNGGYYGGDTVCVTYRKRVLDNLNYVASTPVPKNTPAPSNNVDPHNSNGL